MFAKQNSTAKWDWCSHTSACATIHGVDNAMYCASVPGISMRRAMLAIRLRKHGSRRVAGSMK